MSKITKTCTLWVCDRCNFQSESNALWGRITYQTFGTASNNPKPLSTGHVYDICPDCGEEFTNWREETYD